MKLSSNTISDFVKVIKNDKKENKEKFVYGIISRYETTDEIDPTTGENVLQYYVKIDGSEIEPPVSRFTTTIDEKEKVIIMIKNHSVVVTGNISSVSTSKTYLERKIKTLNTVADPSLIRALWE